MVLFYIKNVNASELLKHYTEDTLSFNPIDNSAELNTTYNVTDIPSIQEEIKQKQFMVGITHKYETAPEFKQFNCMYCLEPTAREQMIGIPVCREVHRKEFVYNTLDAFCSFECAYAELLLRSPQGIYSSSINLIKELYSRSTGNESNKLKPSLDKRLLKTFNGPLDYETFHKGEKSIFRTPTHTHLITAVEYFSG